MVIGEAPGYQEAKQGRPFVGPSGEKLNEYLTLAGWSRADVYVTNLVACRPPGNRVPTEAERLACRGRLDGELYEAKPSILLLLGATAADDFLSGATLRLYHGLPHLEATRVIVPMYHPAAGLHRPGMRATIAQDWQLLPKRLKEGRVERGVDYSHGSAPAWRPCGTPIPIVKAPRDYYNTIAAVDTEVNIADGALVGISISDEPGKATFYRFDPGEQHHPIPPGPLVLHNVKFDLKVLRRHAMDLSCRKLADTMIAAYLVGEPQLGLKPLALKRLGLQMQTLRPLMDQATELMFESYLQEAHGKLEGLDKELHRSMAESLATVMLSGDKPKALARRSKLRGIIGEPPRADVIDVARLLPEKLKDYACADADMTFRLWPGLEQEMMEKGVLDLFWNVEMPLVPVLANMEEKGLAVDRGRAMELKVKFTRKADELVVSLKDHLGLGNPGSSDQVGEVLYKTLGLPILAYTDGGKPSTARWVLETLAETEPYVRDILAYRHYVKLVGTYLDPWLETEGRIHPDFNQVRQASDEDAWGATATGRLSSSGPNFQNIPARTEEGIAVRSCIVAEPGNILVSLDDSQIELVLMAIDANDEEMIEAFSKGADIHAETAKILYGVDEPTDGQRFVGKTINFAWGYGIREVQLARTLTLSGIRTTRERAGELLQAFEARRPKLKARWLEVAEEARERGYATTFWGRRRYLPELQIAENEYQFYEAAKRAYSHRIQGTAADLSKVALVAVDQLVPNSLICAIHDERLLEVPMDTLTKEWLDDIMNEALVEIRKNMPHPELLRMTAETGHRWGEMNG